MAIGVIGGGNMAQAIVGGCVRSGVMDAGGWLVAEPDEEKRGWFAGMGVRCVGSAAALLGELGVGDSVLLAVKPQALSGVGEEIGGRVGGRCVISILAGTGTERVDGVLGCGGRVVRAMPNTPARVGLGMTAVCGGRGASEEDVAEVERVFGGVGRTVRLEEGLMDAFTGVAGSGPAYVFLLVESMAEGGVLAGLSPGVAAESALRTVIGAAALLEGGGDPRGLREAVTSKGGTTAAALEVLERGGFGDLLARAIGAARDRGRVLGEGD